MDYDDLTNEVEELKAQIYKLRSELNFFATCFGFVVLMILIWK